jgi:hypothetical protein
MMIIIALETFFFDFYSLQYTTLLLHFIGNLSDIENIYPLKTRRWFHLGLPRRIRGTEPAMGVVY